MTKINPQKTGQGLTQWLIKSAIVKVKGTLLDYGGRQRDVARCEIFRRPAIANGSTVSEA